MSFLPIMLCVSVVCCCTACQDDEIITPSRPDAVGETIPVDVIFDTEKVQDAYDLTSPQGGATRAAVRDRGVVEVDLLPTPATRGLEQDKPATLTNVFVVQKKKDNTYVLALNNQSVELGKKTTLSLQADDDSELYILARNGTAGDNLTTSNVGTCTITSAEINKIVEGTADAINKMPYFLHLEHVAVTSEGIIQSLQGHDARLRLRRLAARVNVSWNFEVIGYTLQEVTLQETPLKYQVFPLEGQNSYPDLMDQYYTLKLYDAGSDATSAACWVARSVRGTVNISNETMRDKERAPQGSSYLQFTATKDGTKTRLVYRIYLGGNSIQDFNVLDNTNYNYNLTFKSAESIADADGRVQLLNGASASTGNTTFVPTANCFMVKPGGSFHFDPFKFRRSGDDVDNTQLIGWANSRGGICSVKVVWQTRENGDTGDPVLGVANSSSDHSNIVELTNADNSLLPSLPLTDGFKESGKCHIHCRVAPNTIGGNGVIAAYDKDKKILWSWHLWVTDYNPDPHGNVAVSEENKRKQKYTYRGENWLPMMDRNIGAQKGFVEFPKDDLERSRANGVGYSHGRKDPNPGSFSRSKVELVTITEGVVDDLQNMYGPDGYSVVSRDTYVPDPSYQSAEWTFQNILKWGYSQQTVWDGNVKTFYDPSPQGWRVPPHEVLLNFFKDTSYAGNSKSAVYSELNGEDATREKTMNNGGALIQYGANKEEVTYVRLTGYRRFAYSFQFVNKFTVLWSRDKRDNTNAWGFSINGEGSGYNTSMFGGWARYDAHHIRCIQEME